MFKLRYEAGDIISSAVHQIGILALGSHLENHGPALPIDTDAKIASYVALEASLITGAKFLGILYAATEYPFIPHGLHMNVEELVEQRLKPTLNSAKKSLNLKQIVLVNGHGGNVQIIEYLDKIEQDLELEIVFNNHLVKIEGPHASSGELSIGSILGITNTSKLEESCDLAKYPEVGMCGFKEAREKDEGIEKGAQLVEEKGTSMDPNLGRALLDEAVKDVVKDVKKFLDL